MNALRTPKELSRRGLWLFGLSVIGCLSLFAQSTSLPSFNEVTVHDPSVVRAGSEFYVFGSHLQSAFTTDWMHWTQYSSGVALGNPLAPDPFVEFQEALAWTEGNTLWAPHVIRLGDGRYYMYYCASRSDAPRAALGLAVSDTVRGPYKNLGIMLKSGMWGEISPAGTIYDPTIHPNTIDPHVFYDKTGRLWMVYGSYSGGIFILEMDRSSGLPLPGHGYGKKLIGGNHSAIEGPFIFYSPESDYYYLFLSFGGLDANGGYNIRMGRSRNPDGPFLDSAGTDLTYVSGPPGRFFDNPAIEPHGVKLMGNYQFLHLDGEPGSISRGYVSPGGNSAYYDPSTGKHFIIFHTRFVGRGEEHEVRVHQLFLNADDWLVAAPHRYSGESLAPYTSAQISGNYKLVNHGKAISSAVNRSVSIALNPDRSISGAATGTWQLSGDYDLTLSLDGTTYRGVIVKQWDDDNGAWVNAFTALSQKGVSVWGSKAVISSTSPTTVQLGERLALYSHTFSTRLPRPSPDPTQIYAYSLVNGPSGLSVDRSSGVLTWNPLLSQVDLSFPVTILVLNTGTDPVQTFYTLTLMAKSPVLLRRLDLDFSAPPLTGLKDNLGQFTGLSARLPGTGAALPVNQDPHLNLNLSRSQLELTTTQADFNGRNGLPSNSSPGIPLSELGFTGAEDFSYTAVFRPITGFEFIDQAGVFIGASNDALTRAGTFFYSFPEQYSTHTINGVDQSGHFFGFGFNGANGMTTTITRQRGGWRYFVNQTEWNPLTPTSFLNNRADLIAGVFAITPLNARPKTVAIDSLSLVVATNQPILTPLEQWRIIEFGQLSSEGLAADDADPDGDGLSNLLEYAVGTHPLRADPSTAGPRFSQRPMSRRLSVTFNRIADPSLKYIVEGSSNLASGFVPLWNSTGTQNIAGEVTVEDSVDWAATHRRFLRLTIQH